MKVNELLESQLTPAKAWHRLLKLILATHDLSNNQHELNDPEPIGYVEQLMKMGITFDSRTATHWANELMGDVETVRPSYSPPIGIATSAGKNLAAYVNRMIDFHTAGKTSRDNLH